MTSTIPLRAGALAVLVGMLGFGGACTPTGRTPAPRTAPAPSLGKAWPAPACLDEPVPVHDAEDSGNGPVVADGGKLYMRGDDPTTIEVGWEWGGPSAVLARGPADHDIESFAVDDRYVYWSISARRDRWSHCLFGLDGAIYRVAKSGGTVETVVDGVGAPDALAVDSGRLFFRDEGLCPDDPDQPAPRSIKRLDPDSGEVTTIVDDPGVTELVVGPGTLWMLASGELVQTDSDGGGRTVLAKTPDGEHLIVTRDRFFVVINPVLDGDYIVEIPRAGGTPRRVMPQHGEITVVAADADTLYASHGGELIATPLAGGAVEVVVDDGSFAGLAGDRILVWTGLHRRTLESVPRGQRLGELIASNVSKPSRLLVSGDAVYWISIDGLFRRPVGGGATVRLAGDVGFADRMAIAGDKLVIADDGSERMGSGRIGVVPISGGTVTWLATDLSTPLEVAATSTDAIYGDGRGTVWRIPLSGGTPVELATGTGPFVTTLVTDGAVAYFARFQESEVRAVPVRGGGVTTIGDAIDPPLALLLDDRDLVIATKFGQIQRVAATGGTPRTIALASGQPDLLARDASHIYWITTEAIERVPRAGGIKQRVARGALGGLAITEDDVFWSEDTYVGSVRRAPKRPSGGTNQSTEPESGPLAIAGTKAYVGTRDDVRELDLATGEFPVILAPQRTPQWVGTDGTTVFVLAEDKLWAIDVAAARAYREAVIAKTPNTTDRERAFDTGYSIKPMSTSPIGVFTHAIVVGGAVAWTAGDHVYRLGKSGLVQTLAYGLVDTEWIASAPDGTVHVTARDGDRWAVYALGAPAAPPVREAVLEHPPHGLALDAAGVIVSSDDQVVRFPRGGGAPEVLAANQRGAGAVAIAGRAVYWTTRDGIAMTDGPGCGAHHVARWPSDYGALPGNTLVASDAGPVFTDVYLGAVVTGW